MAENISMDVGTQESLFALSDSTNAQIWWSQHENQCGGSLKNWG